MTVLVVADDLTGANATAAGLARAGLRAVTVADAHPGWRGPLVFGWAGMRGVVSLAAALSVPLFIREGQPFPYRDLILFITFIVILVTLAFILLATGQFQSPGTISGRSYLFLVLSGLATGASWICYFRALKIGEAAKVAPIDKLSVVLVALFGVAFLGERLSGPNWLGIALIGVGAVLVAYR